ncbi:MAG: hypothetical protein ACKO1W_04105 [Microcystaceae cyanobacterium]
MEDKFEDSGLVLQDIINQAGKRLGFTVEYGLYQGSKNTIGYDGLWTVNETESIIIEVKTTDAYRINLEHIYSYKRKLTEQKQITENSSILIVVGRKDTGDLEAQIRGSRYGWDFRLISVDSLMKLVQIKENLNDEKTIKQISEILRPLEFTRLDKLIEIVFETTQDIQLESPEELSDNSNLLEDIQLARDDQPVKSSEEIEDIKRNRSVPVNFQERCLQRLESKLNVSLLKTTRAGYQTTDGETGFLCCISKQHKGKTYIKYWFAFHPHQELFLKKFKTAYIVYGCGSEINTFLIPFPLLEENRQYLWTTEKDERLYWHIVIHERKNRLIGSRFEWQIPHKETVIDLEPYRL